MLLYCDGVKTCGGRKFKVPYMKSSNKIYFTSPQNLRDGIEWESSKLESLESQIEDNKLVDILRYC